MGSVTDFLKENYDLVTLFVAVLGVIIAVITMVYEMKKKSRNKKK